MTYEGWLDSAHHYGPGKDRRVTLLACADWLDERSAMPHVAYACRWMAARGLFPADGGDRWWWITSSRKQTEGHLPAVVWVHLTGGRLRSGPANVWHRYSSLSHAVRGLGGALETLRCLVLIDPGVEMRG